MLILKVFLLIKLVALIHLWMDSRFLQQHLCREMLYFISKYMEHAGYHFSGRSGMYFEKGYKEIVKFKGDIQTLYLPHNENLYKEKEKYLELLDQLLQEDMVIKDEKGYRRTHKEIFWGNTLSRELSSLL